VESKSSKDKAAVEFFRAAAAFNVQFFDAITEMTEFFSVQFIQYKKRVNFKKQMIYIAVLCNPKLPQNRSTIPPCSLDPMPLPTIRRF